MKMLLFFEKKIYLGQFDIFSLQAISYCWSGQCKIEQGHC